MKNRFLLFAILIGCSVSLPAQSGRRQKALIIRYDNHNVFSIFLSNKPKLTIEKDNGIIEADGPYPYLNYSWSFPLAENGVSLTFETVDWEGYNEIMDTKVDNIPQFSLKGGNLTVSGQTKGETLSVYSLDGKIIGNAKVGADGKASVQLPGLKTVYIVKSGKANFKILSK